MNSGCCRDCRYFSDDLENRDTPFGVCGFRPPATIAQALGIKDQYEVKDAKTHPEWSCDLFAEGER